MCWSSPAHEGKACARRGKSSKEACKGHRGAKRWSRQGEGACGLEVRVSDSVRELWGYSERFKLRVARSICSF